MSIDRCQRCGDLVDTDNEPEAYVQIGNMRNHEEYICLCRRHREQWEDEHGEPDELEMALAFNELERERLRAAQAARAKEKEHHGQS